MRQALLLVLLCAAFRVWSAEKDPGICFPDSAGTQLFTGELSLSDTEITALSADERPNPVLKHFRKKQRLNKRITAAVLAFPFPFGIVGLHRIYLGTKPYVPVAYVASLGGVFGILPFIDFCAITFDKKNFEHYRDNGQVFMWLNH